MYKLWLVTSPSFLCRLSVAGTFLLSAIPASAENESLWSEVENWKIDYYESDMGCSASSWASNGTSFFIGIDGREERLALDICIVNENWQSLDTGKEYSVQFNIGNETPWLIDMLAYEDSLSVEAYLDSDDARRFVDEFRSEHEISATYDNSEIFSLSLRGSRQAFADAAACTISYLETLEDEGDPFTESTPSSASDPFL